MKKKSVLSKILWAALCFCFVLSLGACRSFEPEQLHGQWESANWSFDFRPDNTMDMRLGQATSSGRYSLSGLGNQIELISEEDKVLFSITVEHLSQDTLKINKMDLGGSNIYTLVRKN